HGPGGLRRIAAAGERQLRRQAGDVVVVESADVEAEDGSSVDADPEETVVTPHVVRTGGSLGAQFMLWETATAVAGAVLGVNPFDQPDVESAKVAARGLLDSPAPAAAAPILDGAVEIRTRGEQILPSGQATVAEAVQALLARVPDNGYVAVMAYLDRIAESQLGDLRPQLAALSGRPT